MLRRLILAFFVLASLTSQASVAFACGMMGGAPVVVKHCCCDDMTAVPSCAEPAGDAGCCQKIVHVSIGPGDQVGDMATPIKLPSNDAPYLLPALLPALLAIVLPPQAHALSWDAVSDHALYGSDLYLRTQRLRL